MGVLKNGKSFKWWSYGTEKVVCKGGLKGGTYHTSGEYLSQVLKPHKFSLSTYLYIVMEHSPLYSQSTQNQD